jgi:hypothetical protein
MIGHAPTVGGLFIFVAWRAIAKVVQARKTATRVSRLPAVVGLQAYLALFARAT